HHRLIDRCVAMWMVLRHHVADGGGALLVARVRAQADLAHGVEDAALHGLEAVAHVRQGARDDHAHRVVEVRLPHLVFDLDRADAILGTFDNHALYSFSAIRWHGRGCIPLSARLALGAPATAPGGQADSERRPAPASGALLQTIGR